MGRFLVLWRLNPLAPWPTDPSKTLELNEKMWASTDSAIKEGKIKEFGSFLDASSGYVIGEGEATDVFASANMFMPYVLFEVHEIIPYEKEKEIVRAICKAQIAAAEKK